MSASDSVSPLTVPLQAPVPAASVSPAAEPATSAAPGRQPNPGPAGNPVVPAAWAPLFAEDDPISGGRARAHEAGIDVVDSATGSLLRFLAALASARTVVQVGTGAGVSGLWLLRGMRPDGVLTSIDPDAESQRLAQAAFRADGVHHPRTRLIAGSAPAVLPRLSDAGYDLVHLDCPAREVPECVVEALRLLRPTGVLVIGRVLSTPTPGVPIGAPSSEPRREPGETDPMEQVRDIIRANPRLTPLLVPVGTGILAAVLAPAPDDGPEAGATERRGA